MPEDYRRLHVLVEGQTEETVVRDTLEPYLRDRRFMVTQSVLVTRRAAGQRWDRGGVGSWSKVAGDVRRLLRDSSIDIVTTMIDYYGFPGDAPGMANRPDGSPLERVEHVERALGAAVGDVRFVPHLILHELEAWVFAAADRLGDLYGDPNLATALQSETAAAGGAEQVNDGPTTAPSKRLLRHRADYDKTLDGPLVIAEFGMPALRRCCPHADDWLRRIGVPE